MMTLLVIAIVITVAVALLATMGIIAIAQRKAAIKAAEKMVAQREKERLILSRIRAEREARTRAQALEAIQKASIKMPVEVKTKRHHRKKKSYGQLLVEDDLRALHGHKRLVDRAGGTQVLSSLYESDKWENPFNHSHYNVREYKVNRKADRKAKKAWQDSFVLVED